MKSKFHFFTILAIGSFFAFASVFLHSCSEKDEPPTPVISEFSPASDFTGATVTITGSNFSATASNNEVKFNGVLATVTAATKTTLTVTVPSGATSGKITVSIDGRIATSATDFTVLTPLALSSFTPLSGIAGTTVTITGEGFSTTATENTVKFNNVSATITTATATQLSVVVPSGAVTGPIKVSVYGHTLDFANAFTIPLPTITSFLPARALPGEALTVTGTNFIAGSLTLNKVKVNGTDATVTAATGTQLTALVPTGASTGKVMVDVGGQASTSASDLEVLIDIPRDGLVAFYPFSGNANDVSGHNLNGTLNGPVPVNDRFGNASRAYSFNAAAHNISMGNPALLQITPSITVAGWINVNTANPRSMQIITKYHSSLPYRGFDFGLNFSGNTPQLGLSSSNGTLLLSYVVGTAPAGNTWIFTAFIIDNKSAKFYQDGVLINSYGPLAGTGTLLDAGNAQAELIIGNDASSSASFLGSMDDIAVYNRALSAAEILQLYQQTITKYN